ncbi:hypothetical protein QUB80_06085 [Chlorogloeopsis sp. ULAP01]|uniref:hypothetical protein n=1 Tax=Chlorogloeopsis sp. ULAP01 TaxID=3056483 RepID=UPI0025AB305B|nr:hypothetical protein [Chlorogloeopsis sp. ULAP01]MDM9380271.1 hypothetical protein [Chlorogloeopsis sp. ULAP01]
MRFMQHSIAWFASVLIFGVTGQASFAFTIIPSSPGATDNWKPTTSYNADGVFGITEVDRRLWTEPLRLGGSRLVFSSRSCFICASSSGSDNAYWLAMAVAEYSLCCYG